MNRFLRAANAAGAPQKGQSPLEWQLSTDGATGPERSRLAAAIALRRRRR